MECLLDKNQERKIRVFVVDDSPLVRRSLEGIIAADPCLEVAETAADGKEALRKMSNISWDVCTLDWQMPGMNGLTVLKHIMIRHPRPTLMLSSFTSDGAKITFDALRYGAVDFLQKPGGDTGQSLVEHRELLRSRIKRAARVHVSVARYMRLKNLDQSKPVLSEKVSESPGSDQARGGLLVVLAATGGYASLLNILPNLVAAPKVPVVLMLSAISGALDAFVEYVSQFVPSDVIRLHRDNLGVLEAGKIYVSGMGDRLIVQNREDEGVFYCLEQSKTPFELFDIIVDGDTDGWLGHLATVVLSSGRQEGITGLSSLHDVGSRIIAQSPDTCLVEELPRYALDNLNAQQMAPSDISDFISGWHYSKHGEK